MYGSLWRIFSCRSIHSYIDDGRPLNTCASGCMERALSCAEKEDLRDPIEVAVVCACEYMEF